MLAAVEALLFVVGRDPHGGDEVDQLEDGVGDHEDVGRDDDQREQVHEEELGVAEQQAVGARTVDRLGGEDRGSQHADHAAHTVAGEDVEGIVERGVGAPVGDGVAGDGGDGSDGHGAAHRDEAGGGGDGYEADDRADAGAECADAAASDGVEEDPGEGGGGRGGVGGEEGRDGEVVGGERAAGVEAEPAEPEQAGADEHVGDVGGRVALALGVVLALAECDGAGEGGDTGRHVDDGSAGEVEHAPLAEEAVRVPGPVADRGVDQEREEDHEEEVAGELDPLGEGAGDERRRDDGELHLEEGEEGEGDGRGEGGVGGAADAAEEGEGGGVADEAGALAAEAVAEGEREADGDPEDGDDGHGDEALEHGRDDVLRADHAAVEEGESRGHEEDHGGGHEHPGGVSGADGGRAGGNGAWRGDGARDGEEDKESEGKGPRLHRRLHGKRNDSCRL